MHHPRCWDLNHFCVVLTHRCMQREPTRGACIEASYTSRSQIKSPPPRDGRRESFTPRQEITLLKKRREPSHAFEAMFGKEVEDSFVSLPLLGARHRPGPWISRYTLQRSLPSNDVHKPRDQMGLGRSATPCASQTAHTTACQFLQLHRDEKPDSNHASPGVMRPTAATRLQALVHPASQSHAISPSQACKP